MHKPLFVVVFLFVTSFASFAQLNKATATSLKRSEDTLKLYAKKMIMDEGAAERFSADSVFIRSLVKTLKTPNSFFYPFDSLETVSRIYAPDSSFRIFSWEYNRDDNYFRQRGAIQMRTADGSLKLFPLIDMSDFTTAPDDSIRSAVNWIGAIYYGIVMKTYNNKNYYTLLGFDDNNVRSTKKWIEVLTFDDAGKPVFGGPFFALQDSKVKQAPTAAARFSIEFKKNGNARVNYDHEMDMIIYDHLISENNEPDKPYTMVPDGDYEGFKWEKGKWVHIDKVFDFKLKDGEAPVPAPIKDAAGNSNEDQLLLQSEKNMEAGKPVQKPSVKPVAPKPAPNRSLERRQPKDENAN